MDSSLNGKTMSAEGINPGVEKELTFGEKYVGKKFNPGKLDDVDKLKDLYAQIIDILHDKRKSIPRADLHTHDEESGEVIRLLSIAITEAQGAQMWAVKAVTWGK
jgi:hypothetical protein